MFAYRLAPQVRVCATDEGAVLLDVDDDKYLSLDPDQACALSLVVDAWPSGEGRALIPNSAGLEGRPRINDSCARQLARVLCERGLLIAATAHDLQEFTPSSPPPKLPQPESELIPWCEMTSPHIGLRLVVRFLQSVLSAALMLRFMPLSAIVARARRRRESCTASQHTSFDPETARRLLSAYSHMRPFLYGQKGRCLFDSLALLEFLARGGVYPTWVVGVRVHPFGSHSWLQHQSFILNGTPTYARAYTPILVI